MSVCYNTKVAKFFAQTKNLATFALHILPQFGIK